MADPTPEELSRIEHELLERVKSTRAAYEKARSEADALMTLQNQIGLNHPDGRGAALKSAQMESTSIEAYAKALRDFTSFILKNLSGKQLPPK